MSISIRKLVSKKKRRYTKQGFDLDLSYITDKVIAMGFPSENMEGVYRNPFKEVFRFLELMHKDHYKVYNLCSERSYDISKFHNRVECFPFDDHNCPTIELLIKFCANVKEWLSAHEKNVAVIHCKAGKGRTGLMICSYMLYSKEWNTPKDALDFYAAMRTYNKKGVTIPSQIRYVHYMGAVMNTFNGKAPEPRTLLLKSITFHALPNVSHVSDIKFSAYVFKTLIYSFKDLPKVRGGKKNKDKKKGEEDEEQLVFELPNVPLHGDIKMDFYEKDTFGSDKLFYFWFNTSLVNTTQEFTKEELDKANKDKNCKVFPSNFKITLQFEPLASPTPENPSNGTVQNLMKMPSTNDLSKAVNQLTTKESAEFTDDEDDDDDEETENLLRDPIKSVDNLLQQLIAIKLNSNNKSDLKSTREFKLFEQGVLDLEMVALDQLTTQQEKLAFWINTFNVLMLYLNISKPPVKNETINERFASLNNRKFNIGGQIFTILDIQFALLRKGKSQPSYVTENKLETYTMAFAATDPRSMYAIEGKDPRIIFALCFGTISSPLIHVYHSSSIYDELDEAVRVFLHSNVFVNDSIKSITLPKILDWYCSDFGKTPEKMLKSLSSYLTSEQKSAVSNGYSVVYQEHDWNPHYSLSHFEQK